MRNHGAVHHRHGRPAAVKAAVMCEDVARTVHIARQLGEPIPIAADRHRRAVRPLPERLRPVSDPKEPTP